MEHGRRRWRGDCGAAIGQETAGPRLAAALRPAWAGISLLALGLGCGIGPRNFRSLNHPAPIVRARSVGYGDNLPQGQVVPALIDRLNDPDPVVRMTAHEELRRRTGQDFGYVSWAPTADRAKAVAQWRAWWRDGRAGPRSNP